MLPANGVRITWRDLPGDLRAEIEGRIGSPVVSATSQSGGFSPGTADRIVTRAGDRFFVKAVSSAINEQSAELARDEIHITKAIPAGAPVPALIDALDQDGWVVLILEDIDGRNPRTPWVQPEIDAARTALTELARTLTPAPDGLPAARDRLAMVFDGWSRVRADPPGDLDPWCAEHLGELQGAADRARAAMTGDTLVHSDIRADNLIVTPAGRVYVVDWPWGCVGPAWLDTALLGANVIAYGGEMSLTTDQRDVVIAATGYFLDFARRPPPPGLPTVRAFQRAQADALIPWVKQRTSRAAD